MNDLWNRRVLGVALGLLVVGSVVMQPDKGEALVIVGPDIIAPPPNVFNNPDGAVNDHQQAFNERQNVLLVAPLAVDGGFIPAGTVVSSHMIFMNILGNELTSDAQTWGFDGIILGVMSDVDGTFEAESSAFLGAIGTIYPGAFANRGLEENTDSYLVAGNLLTFIDSVTQPGDWIRVITLSSTSVPAVPAPSTLLLLVASAAGLVGIARLRSRLRI